MKYKHIGLLSIGHIATDVNQGALPAMLPFFIAAYDLSYAAAAAIVFAVNISSSVVQPLFGFAADRFSKPWLLPGGLMLAGLGLALTGLFQDYYSILLLGIVSGIGIAAYHPEAARLVNFAAGDNKGAAMSLFGVGGTIGFALGPLVITAALLQWGLEGTLILIIPVTIMSLVMIFYLPKFASLTATSTQRGSVLSTGTLKENWSGFARIAVIVSGRSIVFFGLNIFIPIYWISELNQSKVAGATALTLFAGSGIFGNLAGGNLADRIGQKKVMLLGLLGLTVFLPILVMVDNVQLATLLLVPTGFMLFSTYSPAIVMGQGYLPNRIGLSSGVTLGLSVAIGGGAAPFIGTLADLYGVWFALASVSCLPIFIFLLALTLPDLQKQITRTVAAPAKLT